ncbi:MFS transporter [Actinomadura sp. KC06]|uniref:MFS transporter n=1 Tax=Actinomadura sp. KC06 TaxID=2530369 RepID=UPI001051620B|nr:MFS transporter [Actinomadura sp. KC06]TDD35733.1 MFS transporter [Actinomadura sp. KC06]
MSAPPVASARYRDVFGVPEFRVLFALQTLQAGGEAIRIIALSVLTYEETGSSLAAAVVFGAGMLPYVVGGAFLLSLADRVPGRRLLTAFHLLRFAVIAVFALDVVPLSVTILLLVIVGLFAPVGSAAVQGRLPVLLPGDRYVLGRSLFTMTAACSQVAGQGAGGLLLSVLTPSGTLWLAAGTAALAALIAHLGLPDTIMKRGGSSGMLRETWRVNRVLLGGRTTRGLLLAVWLPIAMSVGAEGVLVPYATGLGQAGSAGLILAAAAVGMGLGNLVVGRLVPAGLRSRLTLPLALLTGMPLLFFVLGPGLVAACLLMLATTCGLSYELTVQRRLADAVPEEIQGQTMGLANTGLMTGQALGIAAAGALAEFAAPGRVIAICGAAAIAVSLALYRYLR